MCSNPNIKYPSINVISPDELVIANVESIGSGVFGNCFLKAFTRLGINVVEKQLKMAILISYITKQSTCKSFPTDVYHIYLEYR